jgi:hypothetical protein
LWFVNFVLRFGAPHEQNPRIADDYFKYTTGTRSLKQDVDKFYQLLCKKVEAIPRVHILTVTEKGAAQNFLRHVKRRQELNGYSAMDVSEQLGIMDKCRREILNLRKFSDPNFEFAEADSLPIQLLIAGVKSSDGVRKRACLAFMVGTEVLKGSNAQPHALYSEEEATVRVFTTHAEALLSAAKRIRPQIPEQVGAVQTAK